jgi:hypothetical protein
MIVDQYLLINSLMSLGQSLLMFMSAYSVPHMVQNTLDVLTHRTNLFNLCNHCQPHFIAKESEVERS